MSRLRSDLRSTSTWIALLALFVALGGTSYAALIDLKRSSAAASPGCVSGCDSRASLRYALVIVLASASGATPSTL